MPESDFNTILAQMVAQARPKQAPAPSQVGMLGAGPLGGGGGMATTHQSMMSANIDVGEISKALGLKPEEYYEKTISQIVKMTERMAPENRKAYISNPAMQRFLKTAAEKSPHAYFNTNASMYDIPEASEVAKATTMMGGQPSEAAYAAGVAGPTARQNVLGYKIAEKAPWEVGFANLQQTQDKLEQERRAKEANIGHVEAGTGVYKEQAKWMGPKTQAEMTLHEAQTRGQDALAGLHKEQANQILGSMSRDKRELSRQEMTNFSSMAKKLAGDVYSDVQSTTRRPKINQLASYVIGHVSNIKNINDGDARLGVGAASEYVNMAAQELQRIPIPTGGILGGPPIGPEEDIRQGKIFLNDSVRLMQELGSGAPKALRAQMVDNVAEIAKRIPMSDELKSVFMKWLLTAAVSEDEAGLRKLSGVIKQRVPKWLEQPMGTGTVGGQ